MLAVVYETFTGIEKDKFRKLLMHKRKACQLAFRLLVSKQNPTTVRFKQFYGLMRYYSPRSSKYWHYAMFYKSTVLCHIKLWRVVADAIVLFIFKLSAVRHSL